MVGVASVACGVREVCFVGVAASGGVRWLLARCREVVGSGGGCLGPGNQEGLWARAGVVRKFGH